jgi:FkbM family methyltransferase
MIEGTHLASRLLRFAVSRSYRAERRRRRAYEELFRPVEGGTLIVSAPYFGGCFEMDCRSHILKRLLVEQHYECEVLDAVKSCIDPDRDAIDVGANIGFFAVLMASLLLPPNRVLAVEPTPGARKRLQSNIERNGCRNVIVFGGVAAERSGVFSINVIAGMEEYSSLAKMVHPSIEGRDHQELPVPGKTIDELVEEHGLRPGFIKIDAEGAEQRVLAGSKATIERYRPVVMLEVWPDQLLAAAGGSCGAVNEFFSSRGYSLRECAKGELIALPNPASARKT